ncbi:MAG: HDOD domain-containing protein [Fimbriimonadaceae bacterium]
MNNGSGNFLLRRYVEKAMVDLPALPTVVMQVVQATEKPTVTTNEIENLLAADAAIITKLLKVVNSAYFGLPRQVVNINQAIAILGMHQVRNLVMSIGVLNALTSTSPRILEIQREFWQQSFAAGSCAQQIAEAKDMKKKDREMIFIGGLLHDVGRLFLVTLFNLPYKEVLKESIAKNEPLESVEARILGTTHCELGGILAEKWNFPPALTDMIRYHYPLPDGQVTDDVMCAHIADCIANKFADPSVVGFSGPMDERAKAWIGFRDEQWKVLEDNTAAQVQHAKEMLGMLAA